jgi:hypothetical protein
VENLTGGK